MIRHKRILPFMILGAWLSLLLALALASSLAGCEADRQTSRRVVFWAMGREGEIVQQLLPEFHRSHPDIRVIVQQIPWSAAHEKLLTAYAGGNLPDILQLGNTWLAEFVAIGALQPLDARLAGSALAGDDYYPATLSANRLDGRLYGLPWYVDTRVLFYRQDLLKRVGVDRAPTTWPQWRAALERLQASGQAEYGLLLPMSDWALPVALAWQEGAGLLRDDGRYGDFESAAFRQAFDFYLSFYRHRLAPAQSGNQLANLPQEFARGFFAAFVSGPWSVGELRRHRLPESSAGWSTAPLPTHRGDEPGWSLAGGASLAISRHSRQADAAWSLLEYLSEPEQQIRFYRLSGDLPPRRGSWADPALAGDPALDAFRKQLPRMRATPAVPEWERIAAKIGYYAEQAIRGGLTPDEALRALNRETDAILEKRRWLLAQSRQAH